MSYCGGHFHTSLVISGKAGAYQSGALKGLDVNSWPALEWTI
jgi:hypothetical protein